MYPIDWLEERSGLVGGLKYFLFRKVPGDTGWWHTLGSATLTAFLVQLVTGVILAMYYKPDPADAHSSIDHITNDLTLGWLVRGMHRWGASVFIILMFMHMGRVFLFGAYKYPRELNWIVGVLLLATGLFEGLTGYLLPFDQTAYWATVVAVNINGTAPFVGPFLASLLRGGAEIGPDTLSRFYSLHMLLIPGALMGLIGLHLYLVIRLGVSSPPWSKDAAELPDPEPAAAVALGAHPARPAGDGRSQEALRMSSVDERRAAFQRYKENVKKRGKPFYPFAMFHDTVMSLVVVSVITGLAIVWKYTDHPRAAARAEGRPRDDLVRAAAGLVLLLPLLPAEDLQVARHGDPRHGRDPDDPADDPARAAVRGHAHGAAALAAGPSRWSRRR